MRNIKFLIKKLLFLTMFFHFIINVFNMKLKINLVNKKHKIINYIEIINKSLLCFLKVVDDLYQFVKIIYKLILFGDKVNFITPCI